MLIGKVLLNLETKLSRLEVANDRLADAYDAGDDAEATRQFHVTLDEDVEFIDGIISKVSQLEDTQRGSGKKENWKLLLLKV